MLIVFLFMHRAWPKKKLVLIYSIYFLVVNAVSESFSKDNQQFIRVKWQLCGWIKSVQTMMNREVTKQISTVDFKRCHLKIECHWFDSNDLNNDIYLDTYYPIENGTAISKISTNINLLNTVIALLCTQLTFANEIYIYIFFFLCRNKWKCKSLFTHYMMIVVFASHSLIKCVMSLMNFLHCFVSQKLYKMDKSREIVCIA